MARMGIVAVDDGFRLCGLGYQISSGQQQCAMWLGHESAAVLAVVAAFFGGLAVGALLFGPRSRRRSTGAMVCRMRIVIASWGLILAPGDVSIQCVDAPCPPWSSPAPAWQWQWHFSGPSSCFWPATAAMGATLPAMERVIAGIRSKRDRSPAL